MSTISCYKDPEGGYIFAHKFSENARPADFVLHNHQVALFRVHDHPSPDKVEILRAYLKALAIPATISDQPKVAEFQAIAKATHERPDAVQVHTVLLRSMMQAMYTPQNTGHFGLAYDAYTHFTSPIRRYPDLLLHRVIKAILQGKHYQLPTLPTPGEAQAKLAKRLADRVVPPRAEDAATPSRLAKAQVQGWEAAGLHCSANERRADEASRDVEAWLKCKYMRDYLGEEFAGTVTAVTSFGLFVTLDAMYVEGLVHISELGGDYFRFDELRQELRGERSGQRYAIGTRMQVQVSRVDLDARRIDFRLVQDELSAVTPLQRGPGRSRAARRTAALLRQQEEEGVLVPAADRAAREPTQAQGAADEAPARLGKVAKPAKSGKASAKSGTSTRKSTGKSKP